MTDIRELLNTYSRRNDHRLNTDVTNVYDPLQGDRYIGYANNNFCNDHMNIYLSIDHEEIRLQHYGNYCALAHASAELFCELMYHNKPSSLAILLQEIQTYFSKVTLPSSSEMNNRKFMYIYELLELPMAPNRKRCITLPWEATINAWR